MLLIILEYGAMVLAFVLVVVGAAEVMNWYDLKAKQFAKNSLWKTAKLRSSCPLITSSSRQIAQQNTRKERWLGYFNMSLRQTISYLIMLFGVALLSALFFQFMVIVGIFSLGKGVISLYQKKQKEPSGLEEEILETLSTYSEEEIVLPTKTV